MYICSEVGDRRNNTLLNSTAEQRRYSQNNNCIMLQNSTGNIFQVIFTLEAAVIIIGNTFTIFIFWTQGFHLKRTCFLLINLAVADLLVGITEPIILGTERIAKNARNTTDGKEGVDIKGFVNPSIAFQVLGSSTSTIFLALISLERVHAVLRPLRHRVTTARVYICSIVIVWTVGICMAGITFLPIYHTDKARRYGSVIIHSFLFICVLVICVSYLTIRTRLRSTTPEIEVHKYKSTEQNLRLSRTFFIVAAVSLVFWMPAIIVYSIRQFCKRCVSPTVEMFVKVLHLANSMVNPFVYSFRMPIFNSQRWKGSRQITKSLGDISSLCFEYVSDVSRSYFAGACLRRVVAAPSSRNKHSSLHLQHRWLLTIYHTKYIIQK